MVQPSGGVKLGHATKVVYLIASLINMDTSTHWQHHVHTHTHISHNSTFDTKTSCNCEVLLSKILRGRKSLDKGERQRVVHKISKSFNQCRKVILRSVHNYSSGAKHSNSLPKVEWDALGLLNRFAYVTSTQ